MQWSRSCVNLARSQAHICSQTLFWVFLWRCFHRKLTFKLGAFVQSKLPWTICVGLISSTESLNKPARPEPRKFCQGTLELEWAALKFSWFQCGGKSADVALVYLHCHVSQRLIIFLFLSVFSLCLSFFLYFHIQCNPPHFFYFSRDINGHIEGKYLSLSFSIWTLNICTHKVFCLMFWIITCSYLSL